MLTVLRFDDPLGFRPRRVVVAGVSGTGKTTLATRIAPILDASAASVEALIKNYETALAAAKQARIALAP